MSCLICGVCMACGHLSRNPGSPLGSPLGAVPWARIESCRCLLPVEFLWTLTSVFSGSIIAPSQANKQGLRWEERRTGRATLSRTCLWQERERPRMVFTFSLLSFWWPGWPTVTPLRFVGPRECLHYITPLTTAPKTHTHWHTLRLTFFCTHIHLPTHSHGDAHLLYHTLNR